MNSIKSMIGRIGTHGNMVFFTILIIGFSFAGGIVPSAAYAYYEESCWDCGSSYTDSIDWGGDSSYPSYTDSIDWGSDSYYPSYTDSIDWGGDAYYPSYADSIDWGYEPYSSSYPSYADSIDWSYEPSYPSYPSYADSIDWSYEPYYPTSQNYPPLYVDGECYSGCGTNYSQPPRSSIPPLYVDGKCYSGCYGTPTPPRTPPRMLPPPITGCGYSFGGCGGSTHTSTPSYYNSNTNINTNTNTNINTNINTTSISNVNSNNTTYYPIQTQNPFIVQPVCTITYALANGLNYGSQYNQGALLSWTSTNASSATITNIGSVAVSGSQYVYPTTSTTYTMTVYGQNGTSNSCSTTVPYTYVPPVSNLYCTLTASPNSIQNGATSVLSWTAQGASYATLSDGLGNVAVNGSMSVRPESSRVYTLTVRDTQGRTNTCYTTVTVNGSYVSLTSIPYTGFDGGITENAIYWMGLILWALAAGYFVVRYRGSVSHWFDGFGTRLAYAGPVEPTVIRERIIEKRAEAPVVVKSAPAPAVPTVSTTAKRSSTDTMVLQSKEGETPRLVIVRN